MGVTKESLETALKEKVGAIHVEAVDMSDGCGQNFEVIVVSPQFEGKSVLQKHRMVNDAVKDQVSQLHAFSQKTFTPEKWREANQ
ncbi:hypothetical protein HDV06_001919 [Boothiomyces sp. JEL0866]|nr:hypothetical protein HDV06_001919 [Boothiomyces sp. JEL0866]